MKLKTPKFEPFIAIAGEQWKQIKDFPCYEISNLGRIRKMWLMRTWKDHAFGHGYKVIGLSMWNKRRVASLHSLVAEAFIGPRPKGQVIHHKNNDPKDNRLENLEYCTRERNNFYARRDGLWRSHSGADNGRSKLSVLNVKSILRLYATGNWSQQQLAVKFKVTKPTIGKIVRGQSWQCLYQPRVDHHAIKGETE